MQTKLLDLNYGWLKLLHTMTGDKGSGNGLNYKPPRKNAKINCVPKDDTMSSLETNDARRMRGVNAKKVEHQNIVEVLYFRRYFKHYEFSIDENGYRQKVMKRYINVSVCINLE